MMAMRSSSPSALIRSIPMIATDERKDLAERIRWLLLLRVVTLSFFLGASALFHFFQIERDVIYLISLSLPLILAYLISVGSGLLLPRIHNLRGFAHAQVSFDVLSHHGHHLADR